MAARVRGLNWGGGLITAMLVLPVTALFAFADDQLCNHLEGAIVVVEPDTPRGAWCAALHWDAHWLLVVVVPPVVVLLLMLANGRRPSRYVPIWAVGAALAAWPALIMSGLRAYPAT
jgi:hypothetical protein